MTDVLLAALIAVPGFFGLRAACRQGAPLDAQAAAPVVPPMKPKEDPRDCICAGPHPN